MAATLALMAAFLFAVAATLQQKGALNLDRVSLANPMSLVRLVGQRMWLLRDRRAPRRVRAPGGALDRGRLAVIQPLLVTTIVFALPLGWLLTNQHVGRREIGGAVVIILGLGAFTIYGTPPAETKAPNDEWAIAIVVIGRSAPRCCCTGGTATRRRSRPSTAPSPACSSGSRPP